MTAPELMPDCPTEETLAAFVENRLNPEQRRIVVAHLATCGACRELVMMTTEFQTSNVEPFVRPRRWQPAAAGVAAAAAIVAFLLLPTDMDKLVKATASLKERPMVARVAEDVAYKKHKRVMRSGVAPEELAPGALDVLVAAESDDPHVRGLGQLLTGDPRYRADAIADLRKAQAKAKGDQRDAVDLDLAAALTLGSDKEVKEALALSDGVWERKHLPVAAWNRAVALGLLQRKDDAKRAWNEYLALDSTSQWAEEARTHLADLDETF